MSEYNNINPVTELMAKIETTVFEKEKGKGNHMWDICYFIGLNMLYESPSLKGSGD